MTLNSEMKHFSKVILVESEDVFNKKRMPIGCQSNTNPVLMKRDLNPLRKCHRYTKLSYYVLTMRESMLPISCTHFQTSFQGQGESSSF